MKVEIKQPISIPQILQLKDREQDNLVVICLESSGSYFDCLILRSKSYIVGTIAKGMVINLFERFQGSIILEND